MKSRTLMSFTGDDLIRCDGNAASACRTGQTGQPQTRSLQAHRRGGRSEGRQATSTLSARPMYSVSARCFTTWLRSATHKGIFVGFANTSSPVPYAGLCYVPDCFVAHAFPWRNGIKLKASIGRSTDLGHVYRLILVQRRSHILSLLRRH